MKVYTVTYGGWYQRTTLHLSEIYHFFKLGKSKLALAEDRLRPLHKRLDLSTVVRKADLLEYVEAQSNDITIKYYEDGLYLFETKSSQINEASEKLKRYHQEAFLPAVDYIFSLGAPTPRELASIKVTHPVVVRYTSKAHAKYLFDPERYGEIYSKISSPKITVHKTPSHIFVVTSKKDVDIAQSLIASQIFFREFKDHLERYLDIHRNIWEEIAEIKERKSIRGYQITKLRSKLDGYQKTISLIANRINQMKSYIATRASIAKQKEVDKYLSTIFQYKFETLADTHAYIKELWTMTADYVQNAIDRLKEVEVKTTDTTIRSIQVIATIGVIAGILGYLTKDELPKITTTGLLYFAALLVITWLVNLIISFAFKNTRYKIKYIERENLKE